MDSSAAGGNATEAATEVASETQATVMFGAVMHHRLGPRPHRFRYPVFFLKLNLDAIDRIERTPFAVNRRGWLSFWFADHGARDGSPPAPWIRALLAQHGMAQAGASIDLYAFPRVLGYVFNPVSFWACHDASGALRAVLCEVNNTFGERHNYLVTAQDRAAIGGADIPLIVRKVFHVSPFFDVSGEYLFRFDFAAERALFSIQYRDGGRDQLVASLSGQAQGWSVAVLRRALLRYPLMTFLIVVRIHYHALRLWMKRAGFRRKPPPPMQETTL